MAQPNYSIFKKNNSRHTIKNIYSSAEDWFNERRKTMTEIKQFVPTKKLPPGLNINNVHLDKLSSFTDSDIRIPSYDDFHFIELYNEINSDENQFINDMFNNSLYIKTPLELYDEDFIENNEVNDKTYQTHIINYIQNYKYTNIDYNYLLEVYITLKANEILYNITYDPVFRDTFITYFNIYSDPWYQYLALSSYML
jgi:hypothetical protein